MNILDYIKNQQSLSFSQLTLNELDIALLNELAYLPLTKEQAQAIATEFLPLSELVALAKDTVNTEQTSFMMTENRLALLEAVLASQRFNTLQFGYYINDIDDLDEKQFAAIVAYLPELDYYQLIFRGTDETLIGWKEDFNMTYLSEIPAQYEACRYLTQFLEAHPHQITVSGHSKGGNLAVYASSFVPSHLQHYLDTIYILDAPGVHESVLKTEGYQAIRSRIKAYRPKESIIGVMLASDVEGVILDSTGRGILQHDIFQWQIDKHEFSRVESLTTVSLALQKTFTQWMMTYQKHELKQLSDTFFDLFFKLGIDNLDDLTINLKAARNFLAEVKELDDSKRQLLIDAISQLIGLYHQNSIALSVQQGKETIKDWFTYIQNSLSSDLKK